jgi:hypothetical protein
LKDTVHYQFKYKLSLIMLVFSSSVIAQTSSYDELQSAYLFNFAKYIKWPEETKVFTIGVFGEADIMEELVNVLRDKKVWGADIEVKKITSLDKAGNCHIIYMPESNSRNLSDLKLSVTGKNILIVTEDDLIKKGAVICFVMEEDKLRFKLNKKALTEAGLVASEGLLKLAITLND